MDITRHPIWKGVAPYKKPFHFLRIKLARQYAKLIPADRFIGVTGSVGKTTTVQTCKAVLSKKLKTLATTETSKNVNLDPIFNIPMTLLRISPKVKKIILEMGVEYVGDMSIYLDIVKPKTAILTKISYVHSEFFGSVNQIIEEKSKLFAQLPNDGLAILNWDDLNSRRVAEKCKAQVVYYGTDSSVCLVWAENIRIENYKTVFELNCGVERVRVELKLLGTHQVYAALAAATLGVSENISLIKIKHALESVVPDEHRMQTFEGPNGSIILDDTYNADPSAVEAAIDTLLQIPARRRVIVLGEMKELGSYTESMHQEIARKIYKEKVDLVFLGQGNANLVAEELKRLGFMENRMEVNLQNSQMVAKLIQTLEKGDVCLVKGAHSVRLDEVVKRITKKN
ncbi:hypothetical protein HYW42_03070 [Candidatus Daviesbacteria bacterium]|nr:hypothetical protein [Candidatus Daviesbacteria bacterium]